MISFLRLPFRDDNLFSIAFLSVLLIPLAFTWNTYEKYETIKLSLWMILLGWLMLMYFFRKRDFYVNRTVLVLLSVFVFLGLVSTFLGFSKLYGLLGLYPRYTSGFLFYFLWAVSLLALCSIADKYKWQALIRLVFFDAVIIACVGILQSFGIGFYTGLEQAVVARAPGLLGNPNFSAMFLAAALPFALPLAMQASSRSSKFYYGAGSLLILWSVVNFSSRGAWLAVCLGFLILILSFFLVRPKKKVIFSTLAFFVAFAVILSSLLNVVRPGSIVSVIKLSETNVDLRFFAWDVAMEMIEKYPYFGFGPGSTQNYFERFRGPNLARQSGVFDDVHNLPLQMASTTGVPFAVIFLSLLGIAFFWSFKRVLAKEEVYWHVAAMASLASWLLASMFTPVSIACFLLLIVVLCGMLVKEGDRLINSNTLFFKSAWSLAGLALLLGGLVFIVSEIIFYRGVGSYAKGQYGKSANQIKLAIRLNPLNPLYYLYLGGSRIMLNFSGSELTGYIQKISSLIPNTAYSRVMGANLNFLMYDRTGDDQYLKAAISQMEESLKIDKYSPSRYAHIAFYYAQDGQLEAAKEKVELALKHNFQYVPAWLLLSRIYQLEERWDQMLYCIGQAYRSSPDNVNLQALYKSAESSNDKKNLSLPVFINILQIEP